MPPVFRSDRARWITALGHSSGKLPPERTCKYVWSCLLWKEERGGVLPSAGRCRLNGYHHTPPCVISFPQDFPPAALHQNWVSPALEVQGSEFKFQVQFFVVYTW